MILYGILIRDWRDALRGIFGVLGSRPRLISVENRKLGIGRTTEKRKQKVQKEEKKSLERT